MPYCFSGSSFEFQGHTGWKIDDLNPIWVRLLGWSQLSDPSDLPCSVLADDPAISLVIMDLVIDFRVSSCCDSCLWDESGNNDFLFSSSVNTSVGETLRDPQRNATIQVRHRIMCHNFQRHSYGNYMEVWGIIFDIVFLCQWVLHTSCYNIFANR